MKQIFLILFLIGCTVTRNVYAQDAYKDLYKYWRYKQILNNDHVAIGPGPGESIPFDINWEIINTGAARTNIIGGSSELGYYISVLATEYALLKKSNESTTQVIEELYYALHAYYRLEKKAADWFLSPNYTGFFIRSDFDPSFLASHPHFTTPDSIIQVSPDYINGQTRQQAMTTTAGMFNSIDQDLEILLGVCLVKRYVDSNVTYTDPQGNTHNILNYAVEIADRLFDNYHANNWLPSAPLPVSDPTNPGQNTYTPSAVNSCWGGSRVPHNACSMASASYPMAYIYSYIKGTPPAFLNIGAFSSATAWNDFAIGSFGTALSAEFAYSNKNAPIILWATSNRNIESLALPNWIATLGLIGASTWFSFNTVSSFFDFDEVKFCKDRDMLIYPIIRELLYDNNTTPSASANSLKSSLEQALHSAPCNRSIYGAQSKSALGWRSSFRWTSLEKLKNGELADCELFDPLDCNLGWSTGYGNGLDYMLAYNLYHLMFLPNLPYKNVLEQPYNISTSVQLPYNYKNNGDNSTVSNPLLVSGQNIDATNKVLANKYSTQTMYDPETGLTEVIGNYGPTDGGLVIRGYESISLEPGFEVKTEAYFRGYIDALDCVSSIPYDGGVLQRNINTDNQSDTQPQIVAKSLNTLSLHPNPASDHLIISGLGDMGFIHQMEIFSINGQSVQKTEIAAEKAEIELNVSELPQGVYILKVDTENGQKVEKFIKE